MAYYTGIYSHDGTVWSSLRLSIAVACIAMYFCLRLFPEQQTFHPVFFYTVGYFVPVRWHSESPRALFLEELAKDFWFAVLCHAVTVCVIVFSVRLTVPRAEYTCTIIRYFWHLRVVALMRKTHLHGSICYIRHLFRHECRRKRGGNMPRIFLTHTRPTGIVLWVVADKKTLRTSHDGKT